MNLKNAPATARLFPQHTRQTSCMARCLLAILGFSLCALSQTFHGSIAGSIVDATSAAVANSAVRAVSVETGLIYDTRSGPSGDFLFANVPPGDYDLTIEHSGFQTLKVNRLTVSTARTTNYAARLAVAEQSSTVEVTASTVTLETTSTGLVNVVNRRQVQDMPISNRSYRFLIRLMPGTQYASAGPGGINGSRGINQNHQIDGGDNNDAFFNSAALSTSQTQLPIEAIDQLSVVSTGAADFGRNSGATMSVLIKSGGNQPHGSLFYTNRNEAFATHTPFQDPATTKKRPIRQHLWGGSTGGAMVKNRLFYFTTLEGYVSSALTIGRATHPSTPWVNNARAVMQRHGVAVNPVSTNLLRFWPSQFNDLPASANNYLTEDPNRSDSVNAVLKLDYSLTSQHNLSARYLGGSGNIENFNVSPYAEYLNSNDSRAHSFGVNLNSTFSHRLMNQVILAASYNFLYFKDRDASRDPHAAGLNTGVPQDGALAGLPALRITNFAGASQPSPTGRMLWTGHITDNLSWILGRYTLKLGGEFRRQHNDVFFYTNSRGTFNFDGTRGPWATDPSVSLPLRSLADFLAGLPTNNNGATIVRGELQRVYVQTLGDWWLHDTWQIKPKLSLNFGLRWSYVGPITDQQDAITSFSLANGFERVGHGGIDLWRKDFNNFAPRLGFAYQLSPRFVLRGSYGLFYDTPAINSFVGNLNMPNGGSDGIHANPAGPDPVFSINQTGVAFAFAQPVFPATATPRNVGAFGVSRDWRLSYIQNYNLNVQHQVNPALMVQIGYVGSRGTALPLLRSINPVIAGRRLHAAQYPLLAAINVQESIGNSNYHSFQAMLRATRWKNFTLNGNYTWSKTLDNGSAVRATLPANSFDLRREYGPASFDNRHTFTGLISYDVPAFGKRLPYLFRGWQVNSLIIAAPGDPLDLLSGTNRSGVQDNRDRVDVIGDRRADIPARANTFAPVPWFNPRAFAPAALGTFGNVGRNSFQGPGLFTVDVSIFKDFPITESVRAQFRVETYNLSNRYNWSPPGVSLNAPASFGLITGTRSETRLTQLTMRLAW